MIVLKRAERVLLLERADHPGAWQFPQGGMEAGETFEQAALRELKEELGTNSVKLLRISSQSTRYEWPEPGRGGALGQEHRWVLAEFLPGEDPRLDQSDGSFARYEWVEPKEVFDRIMGLKKKSSLEGLRDLGLL